MAKKSLGGALVDNASSIQQTNDGGYIVAGVSTSNDGDVSGNHGTYDYWLVKLNDIGIIEWQKSLGGSGSDAAYAIQQTNDEGYIVIGISDSNDGDVSGNHGLNDCWVVKLNDVGAIEWQKSLGGSGSEYATSIQQTNDGGFIVAGRSSSIDGDVSINQGMNDYWVVKLTGIGAMEWQKSVGGSINDLASSIYQTNDGGYIVAGSSISTDGDVTGNQGSYDFWLVKLNTCQLIESTLILNDCNPISLNGITYTTSGIYTQNFINGYGCDSFLTIDAEILDFNAQIFQTDTTLYYNGNPTSIQWFDCITGQTIQGANEPVFVPQLTGNYAAIVNIGSCSDTSNCRLIPVPPIPKLPPSLCDNLIVSPNPVNDFISFSLDKELYDIRLFSATGGLVWQNVGNPEKQKISFQHLAPAVYVLEIDQCRFKIVKQ